MTELDHPVNCNAQSLTAHGLTQGSYILRFVNKHLYIFVRPIKFRDKEILKIVKYCLAIHVISPDVVLIPLTLIETVILM